MMPWYAELFGLLVRWVLTVVGTHLIDQHLATADQMDRLTNDVVKHAMMAAVVVAPIIWSLVAKYRARQAVTVALQLPAGSSNDQLKDAVKSPKFKLGPFAFFAFVLLLPSTLAAQTFGYDDTWTRYPITPAVQAVKDATSRGLCAESAVDWIAQHTSIPASFVPRGSAPSYLARIEWYGAAEDANGKPAHCDGKFQFPAADGPYSQGWEIRFNGQTWANGLPTQWQIHPFAEPTGTYTPPPSPPPVVTPPPPPPIVPVLAIDYDRIAAIVKADGDQTRAAVNEPGWFKKAITNPYVQGVLVAIGTCASTQCWKAKQ